MPVSSVQAAKRLLVSILLKLARRYNLKVVVTRDSTDQDVHAAYRRVALKTHPDKGGSKAEFQELGKAKDEWEDAKKTSRTESQPPRQRPQQDPENGGCFSLDVIQKGFRIHSGAVLLTYSGIKDMDHWKEFVQWVRARLKTWGVLRWCATLEESRQHNLHIHLMLQFTKEVDRTSRSFCFSSIAPNCGPNGLGRDLGGHGICRRKYQQSVDRGMFYVFADKKGTVKGADGKPIWAGNYAPAWVEGVQATYAVMKEWPQTLWTQYKLEREQYEEYLYRCRGNIGAHKRAFDDYCAWEDGRAEEAEIEAVSKRIKSNTDLYQPFRTHAESTTWLKRFGGCSPVPVRSVW